MEEIVGFSPTSEKLMVEERNIKVGAVPTH
jgi:hypothetical protein